MLFIYIQKIILTPTNILEPTLLIQMVINLNFIQAHYRIELLTISKKNRIWNFTINWEGGGWQS
nr:hypothetical protein BN993_02125 [Virgibacillus halodenitrificans]